MDETQIPIPEALKQALAEHPFHKIAGTLYGLDFTDRYEVLKDIGTKLAMATLEQQTIREGLQELAELEKQALFGLDDPLGGAIGYNYGRAQHARGVAHAASGPAKKPEAEKDEKKPEAK